MCLAQSNAHFPILVPSLLIKMRGCSSENQKSHQRLSLKLPVEWAPTLFVHDDSLLISPTSMPRSDSFRIWIDSNVALAHHVHTPIAHPRKAIAATRTMILSFRSLRIAPDYRPCDVQFLIELRSARPEDGRSFELRPVAQVRRVC